MELVMRMARLQRLWSLDELKPVGQRLVLTTLKFSDGVLAYRSEIQHLKWTAVEAEL